MPRTALRVQVCVSVWKTTENSAMPHDSYGLQSRCLNHPTLAAASLLGLLVTAVFTVGLADPVFAQNRPTPVVVDKVIIQPFAQTMPVTGRFVATESGVVAARVAERVAKVVVRVGDRVKTGDTLASLSADRLGSARALSVAELRKAEAQMRREKANLAKMRQTYDRIVSLKGSAAFRKDRQEDSERDLEVARSAVGQAEAELLRAKANLDLSDIALRDAIIRAPYPGVVIACHTVSGNFVRVGDPIVTLLNDEDLEIEADVPAVRTLGLRPGTMVEVALQDGRKLAASVRVVVQEENSRTRTRGVRLHPNLPKSGFGIVGNQSVMVEIPIGGSRDVVTVHKDAIVISKGRPMAYVVIDGKAEIRPVLTGNAVGNRFEVVRGLKPGEIVVVRGNERLRPGQLVTPFGSG
ncbi:MAG: hypothetical protein CMM47_11795 [Rhodospirillaceae bacterium]|nr:hypothetical protein [Rhodospirillaceae bacterium]